MFTTSGVSKFVNEKILHVNSSAQDARQPSDLEERAKKVFPHPYLEQDPTVSEWLRDLAPTRQDFSQYMHELFPFVTWIARYNLRWMIGDAIAGLTIGFVVVPQAMAYALLARLSPEYGLYTSFTGAVLYWLFGTSKDIVIGTTAVGSLLVGEVVTKVIKARPDVYSNEEIAKALSLVAGAILLVLGLLRLGWLIEFIPYVPISAFVTAASITIMSTQFPVVMGITGINTREAPYKVIINTIKGLDRARIDAAIGLSSIALLFFLKYLFGALEARQPSRKRMWSTISSLRLTFTMLLFTFISWLVHRKMPKGESKFRIVGVIQSGFKHAGPPNLDPDLLRLVIPQLPAIVIILIIEHIAIAKSFGRTFGYTVITSQEMCAQGAANLFSPFVGGYVCTGSFGASAVLSKAGARTPITGLFSAFILILALYALTGVFYYIPMAALAGLIVHAVWNLGTSPKTLVKYWRLSPFELVIWVVGVVLALFTSLEMSIYVTIGLSFVLILLRVARTKGRIMGQVQIHHIEKDNVPGSQQEGQGIESLSEKNTIHGTRPAYLPLDRKDSSNPNIPFESPYPGVFIYRFSESLSYINQAYNMDFLLTHVHKHTRRTAEDDGIHPNDRLWNDPPPSPHQLHDQADLPTLRAIILDCSAINNIDITSIQGLVDLRTSLDRHASPDTVHWHFASLHNRWARKALAMSGFGAPNVSGGGVWTDVYTVADCAVVREVEEDVEKISVSTAHKSDDGKSGSSMVISSENSRRGSDCGKGVDKGTKTRIESVYGVDRPFFHVDLADAVEVAVRAARRSC